MWVYRYIQPTQLDATLKLAAHIVSCVNLSLETHGSLLHAQMVEGRKTHDPLYLIILVKSGCSNKTPEWVVYKQQKHIPPSSRGWSSEISMVGLWFWWEPTYGSQTADPYPQDAEGRKGAVWGLFPKGVGLFHGGSTLMTQELPGAILIPSHLGFRFHHRD